MLLLLMMNMTLLMILCMMQMMVCMSVLLGPTVGTLHSVCSTAAMPDYDDRLSCER